MTEQMSHVEAHKAWSHEQLALFRQTGTQERLNIVKSGALEHWTETARATALGLLGNSVTRASGSPSPKSTRFDPAHHPLPRQAKRAKRIDLFMIAAGGGWAAITMATAAHAYGLY